jgi:sulfhydrogenase subunit alpha
MTLLNLDHIAKIEGHARLHVKVAAGKVVKAELQVLEGARYFEGILKGKKFNDLSHIASRICGVCSVVHTLASVNAVEDAFSIKISEQTKLLRELLNIGGMIQSHILHLYFLTLPDYAGVGSAIGLAGKSPALVERALRLKRLGNHIVVTVAGRDVHPIACVIGGFSRTPDAQKMGELLEELKRCKMDAVETVKMFMDINYPDFERKTPHFALGGGSYFYSDSIVRCEGGTCFETKDYASHFKEYLRAGSTAEFATQEGKSYFVGALARISNNIELMSSEAQQYAKKICEKENNPFMNIPAQALEVLEGINRAIVILSNIKLVEEQPAEFTVKPCECSGISAIEAPRGILFHEYRFDPAGNCTFANITTPTTQNLKYIEESIKEYLQEILGRGPDEIKKEIEKLIRAYDPCISCSTHFLELNWEEEPE